jgi:hypothetical protein
LQNYTITWYLQVARPSRYSKYVINLAICEYSGKVAFIAIHKKNGPVTWDALKPYIIKDVTVNEKACSDGNFCLNIECPLNHADMTYFKRKGLRSQSELAKVHNLLEKIREELDLKVLEPNVISVFKKPSNYITKNTQRIPEQPHNIREKDGVGTVEK